MPKCQGIIHVGNGEPCPKMAKRGEKYCRWHDPEDESWHEIYDRLAKSSPKTKEDIVLGLIEDHPERKLVLPVRTDGQQVVRANLYDVDFGRGTLSKKWSNLETERPAWISGLTNGIFLDDANLVGANLEDANLQYGDLSGANLQNANLFAVNLEGCELGGANLQNAMLGYANLRGASLFGANFQEADLEYADVQGADFQSVNLRRAKLKNTRLQGVDLSNVKDLSGAYFAGVWLDRTRMGREQLGNAIGEERERDYAEAKRGYLALKQNFDDLGDYDSASWAYRKERRMEKLEAMQERHYLKFFSDMLIEWLCDYGESVWRVVGWIVALLFFIEPPVFSLLGGFAWDSPLAHDYFALSASWDRIWFSYRLHVLYSLGGFSTANFSGLQPANDAVKLASGLFSVFGIFLVGLLGFVAGNRIRRS